MRTSTATRVLIQVRMEELNLDRHALGFRLGYKNPAKAAGRVDALCWGHLTNRKSRAALARLPDALELPAEVVAQAVIETEQVLEEQERHAEEERRLAREKEEAEWRAAFTPHAILQTERTVPSQITICGLTGGARRWLWIDFDLSKPPITFVQQALGGLAGENGPGQRRQTLRHVLWRGGWVHRELYPGSGTSMRSRRAAAGSPLEGVQARRGRACDGRQARVADSHSSPPGDHLSAERQSEMLRAWP